MRNRSLALTALALLCAAASPTLAQTFGAPSSEAPPAAAPSSGSVELAPRVTLDGVRLTRLQDKGVLQLDFTVTNRSETATSLSQLGLATNIALVNLRVVDFANKRRYAMGEAQGECLCSTFGKVDGGLVKPGETRTFWAWYALPPSDVQQMSLVMPDRSPVLNIALR